MFFAKELGTAFSSIKIAGLDIQLRELKDSLYELRLLAKGTTSVLLETVQATGRWSGFTENRKKEILENSIEILKKLGVSNEKIMVLLESV